MLLDLPKSEGFTSGSIEDRQWLYDTLALMDKDAKEKYDFEHPLFAFYGQDQKNRSIIGFDGSGSGYFINYDNFLDASLYGTILVYDYLLENYDYVQDYGLVIIDDWEKMNMKMFFFFMRNPSFLTFFQMIPDRMPIKLDHYYIVNGPIYVSKIYDLMKVFMSEEKKNSMTFEDDMNNVIADIGEDGLPEFLKGDRKFVLGGDSIDVEPQFMKIFPRKRQ